LSLPRAADGRLVLAVDVSPWLRPDAEDGEIVRDEQVAQPQFGPVADTARAQWFGDQSLYGEHRIERGVRILEDRCGWPARSPAAAHRSRR
jgi:hypothetical protein